MLSKNQGLLLTFVVTITGLRDCLTLQEEQPAFKITQEWKKKTTRCSLEEIYKREQWQIREAVTNLITHDCQTLVPRWAG